MLLGAKHGGMGGKGYQIWQSTWYSWFLHHLHNYFISFLVIKWLSPVTGHYYHSWKVHCSKWCLPFSDEGGDGPVSIVSYWLLYPFHYRVTLFSLIRYLCMLLLPVTGNLFLIWLIVLILRIQLRKMFEQSVPVVLSVTLYCLSLSYSFLKKNGGLAMVMSTT